MPESEILVKYRTDKPTLDATLKAGEEVTASQRELLEMEKRLAKVDAEKQARVFELTTAALEQLKLEMKGLEGEELAKAQIQALAYESELQKVLIKLQKQKVAEEAAANALEDKAKAAKEYKTATQQLTGELGKIRRQDAIEQLARDAAKLAEETKDAEKAAKKLAKQLERVGATEDEIKSAASQFARFRTGRGGVSGTEIAGDVAGRSAQIRGAFDVFAGGQLGAVGGLLEGVEAVADLREAMPLLAQNAKDAVSGLSGAGGLTGALSGLVGGAGTAALALGIGAAAIGGVVIAMNALSKESEKQAKLLASTVEATRDVNQQIVAGLTSEDAQQRLEELNALREKEKDIYDELKAGQDELNDKLGVTRDVVGLVNKQIPQLNEDIKNSETLMQSYDAEIEALNEALTNGALEANDAAQKSVEQSLQLAEVEAILAAARAEATGKTREVIAIEEALASGLLSAEQAAEAEKFLASEREKATKQTDELGEAQKEQQRAIEEQQRKAEQAAQRAAQAHTTYANAIDDAGRAARQAAQDTKTKLVDSLKDLSTGYQRQLIDDALAQREDLYDLQQEQFSDEQRAYRDQARAVRDLIKQASRSQEDLLAERDFLSLDQLAKQTERELDDQKQAAKDEGRERDISNREALRDMQLQNARLRRERQTDYTRQSIDQRTAANRELRDIQTAKQRQLEQARVALRRELEIANAGKKALLNVERALWKERAAIAAGQGSAGNGGSSGPSKAAGMQTELFAELARIGIG
jgi:hypothetical protein